MQQLTSDVATCPGFLLDEVHDPLCHEVFERINNDDSRHLAVDFHVMGQLGASNRIPARSGRRPGTC